MSSRTFRVKSQQHAADLQRLKDFGAALAQRVEGRTAAQANLYLRRYERTQIELFNLLGRLDLAQADRDALKVGFFGREIADILGQADGCRSERHESASQ